MKKENQKLLPFHEAVVEIIANASNSEMFALAKLLLLAKIPKGHAQIIAAWKKRCRELDWREDDLGVEAGIIHQEAKSLLEAAKKADCKCGASNCQEDGREYTVHP